MIEIIAGWEQWVQVVTLIVVLLSFYDIVKTVAYHLAVLFRGWPGKTTNTTAGKTTPAPLTTINCDHDDNIEGYCLLTDANCATKTQCEQVVEKHNARCTASEPSMSNKDTPDGWKKINDG